MRDRQKNDEQHEQPDVSSSPGPGQRSDRHGITPVDIQRKEFRLAFRGYSEREVDSFLDEVTEESARIVPEAEARARAITAAAKKMAGPGPFVSSKGFINAFLSRERDF